MGAHCVAPKSPDHLEVYAMGLASSSSLTERAAAEYLCLSVRTLQKRRFDRQEPPYLKIGRSVRYRREDLDAFLEKHRVDPGQGA